MQGPESGKHQRVIDRPRAGPDFFQSERPNDARVLGQMRFIIPNESGSKNTSVGDKNESDQQNCPNPGLLPERLSRTTQFVRSRGISGHRSFQLTTEIAVIAEKNGNYPASAPRKGH